MKGARSAWAGMLLGSVALSCATTTATVRPQSPCQGDVWHAVKVEGGFSRHEFTIVNTSTADRCTVTWLEVAFTMCGTLPMASSPVGWSETAEVVDGAVCRVRWRGDAGVAVGPKEQRDGFSVSPPASTPAMLSAWSTNVGDVGLVMTQGGVP